MERIFKLCNGDRLTCTEQAAVFQFSGPRMVLSTGASGGGMRDDLTAAFNYCDCGMAGVCQPMQGNNLWEHQRAVARRLGLDPDHTTGLDTAANLDNMVVITKRWEDLQITAAVSGGADVNALCAGDPAFLTEADGAPTSVPPGTINIFLITDRPLAPGTMAELILTATEAKTAVLRDLMQGSSISRELATGTGTDGMVIICGTGQQGMLLNAGKHKFENWREAVREAVTEALFRQTAFVRRTAYRAQEVASLWDHWDTLAAIAWPGDRGRMPQEQNIMKTQEVIPFGAPRLAFGLALRKANGPLPENGSVLCADDLIPALTTE